MTTYSGTGPTREAPRPPCTRWNGERCTLDLYGGAPTVADCTRCDSYDGPDRGLGDRVERLLKATGVHQVVKAAAGGRDCGCSARRTKLNKLLPADSGDPPPQPPKADP